MKDRTPNEEAQTYFVLARQKGSQEPYQFVSYKRKISGAPLDPGIVLHNAQDFAMTQQNADIAQEVLGEYDFETILATHNSYLSDKEAPTRSRTGIDLDRLVLERKHIPDILKEVVKNKK